MDFAQASLGKATTTTNGMAALKSSMDSNVDLFFKIGASRGKDILPAFQAAFVENNELALRIALWARDIRGGSGERQLFRDILAYLESADIDAARSMILAIPEVGRWDDIFALQTKDLRDFAFGMVQAALASENALCAKWMPRKGKDAEDLRAFLSYSPKRYRKTLVTLTQVVETQMCAKDWDNINFGHVPSVAASRYRKAFKKNAEAKYKEYADALAKGEAKINAGAVYPYDVLKGHLNRYTKGPDDTERKVIVAQWDALPNYVGDASILAMPDVSGSMSCPAGNGKMSLSCMDVAVSLALYLSDKNTGPFKDMFMTFTETPTLQNLSGDILEKASQIQGPVGFSTNLEAAFKEVLRVAVEKNASDADMPRYILILSDMQFNGCMANPKASAMDMIRDQYKAAGYTVPNIVFWNLNARDNVPTKFDDTGVALVSGFSPSIMTSILGAKNLTPESIMLEAVMKDRYAIQ